jgi:hypothetical protein
LTDFGPNRAERWPMIDSGHFEVHDQGDGWAEVTEGNNTAWERERYTWDSSAGRVSIETLESNVWGPGSGWTYDLTPADGGTSVKVSLVRHAKSFKGHLIGALIPFVAGKTLSKQLSSVLRRAESA